jgi:uncharacterized protein (TIRG00374 family)
LIADVSKSEEINKKVTKSKRLVLKYLSKAIISGFLFYWILKDANFNEIGNAIKTAKWYVLVIAFSLHFVGLYISAVRWRLLLKTQGVDSRIPFLLKSYLVAIFFNNFLPSTIGGDTIRAYDSWRLGKNKANAVAVVFIDRFLGLLALLTFAIVAVFFANQITSKVSFVYLWVSAAALLAFIIILMIFFPNRKIFNWLNKLSFPLINKIISKVEKIGNSFWNFRNEKRTLLISLLLSLLLQANVVFYYFLISVSLNFGIEFYNFFLIIPLSIFVMMLPISVNGIGLRENTYFFFLSIFSIVKANAIAFAWIEFSFILIQGLVGGLVYAIRK